jgi:hypothetical protein
MTMEVQRHPADEGMRQAILAAGWSETMYGTFLPPRAPWYKTPRRLHAAYAELLGWNVFDRRWEYAVVRYEVTPGFHLMTVSSPPPAGMTCGLNDCGKVLALTTSEEAAWAAHRLLSEGEP